MPKNGVNKENKNQSTVVSRLSAVFSSQRLFASGSKNPKKSSSSRHPELVSGSSRGRAHSLAMTIKKTVNGQRTTVNHLQRSLHSRTLALLPTRALRRTAYVGLSATLIATASIPVLPVVLPAQEVEAAWYNEDWRYRAPVDITSPTIQANVYMSLTLDTSNADKFNPDCSDLRFVSRSGQLIPHHIASGCGTGSTQIQILFGELPAGASQIYLYYGNSQASNTSIPEPFNNIADGTTGIIQAEESSQGPVAHWKFDEGYGATAHDSASSQKNGSMINNPTWQTEDMCVSGKCLQFDGVNDGLSVGTKIVESDSVTISFWLKIPEQTSSYNRIFSDSNLNIYFSGNGTNGIYGTIGNSTAGWLLYAEDLADNKWHHITLIASTELATVNSYLDGKFHSQGVDHANSFTNISLDQLVMGKDYTGSRYYLKGFLDDPKIYNYARTQSQIQQDYVAGMTSLNQQGGNLSNGLVGYWKMDEASWNGTAGEVKDSSGNGNNGVAVGNATTGVGRFGSGGSFDGVTQSIEAKLAQTGLAYTYSAWVKTSESSEVKYVISNQHSAHGFNKALQIDDGRARLASKDSSNNTAYLHSSSIVADENWHLITAVVDWGALMHYVYVDGVLDGSAALEGSPLMGDSSYTYLGQRPYVTSGTSNYLGHMDEVRIYSRAITASEVQQLYNYAPKPVGYWDFEDHSTGSGQEGVVYDKSGNGNDGVWSGVGSRYSEGKAGKSGEFNGVDSDISMGDALDFPTNDFTISAWIKPRNLAKTIAVVAKKNSFVINPSDAGYGLSITSEGYLRFNLGDGTVPGATMGGTAGTSLAPYLNSWVHVAASISRVSGGTSYLYINGAIVSSSTSFHSKGSASNDLELKIGSIPDNNYFYNGAIDEVNIYNYARNQQQILEDMQGGKPAVNYPVGHWKFDEGQGTVAHNSGIAGSDLNGEIIDPTWSKEGKVGGSIITGSGVNAMAVPDTSLLDIGPYQDFTYSLWIKRGATSSTSFVLSKGSGGTGDTGYSFVMSGGVRPLLELSRAGEAERLIIQGMQITDNQWHRLTFVHNRKGGAFIYQDGVKVGEGDISSYADADLSNGKQLTIGCYVNTATVNCFDGAIDDVKMHLHALTPQEVLVDYNHSSAMVAGNTSTEPTTSDSSQPASKPSNSAGSEYCVPGSDDYCAPPVGEWKFESKDGVTVEDSSGNGNNTTLSDGAVIDAGKLGKAGNFSENLGAFAQPISGNLPDLTAADGSFTAMAWVNRLGVIDYGGTAGGGILGTRTQGGIGVNIIGTNSLGNQIGTISQYHSIAENEWQHVVLVYDGTAGTTSLFINGVLLSSKNAPAVFTQFGSASGLTIGNSHWRNTRFNGKVDEVRFYNYVRTPAQIAWDYNKGKPIAHYKFDECQGNTIHDSSGNGLHGLLNLGSGGETNIGTCDTLGAWSLGKTGKYNSGMSFDGIDDYVISSGTIAGSYSRTISAWIKPESSMQAPDDFPVVVRVGSPTIYLQRYSGRPVLQIWTADGNRACLAAQSITPGDWQHITATYESSGNNLSMKVYINGVESCSVTHLLSQPISIGSNDSIYSSHMSQPYHGLIDDVQIFNYALTEEQVKVFHNGGAVRWE